MTSKIHFTIMQNFKLWLCWFFACYAYEGHSRLPNLEHLSADLLGTPYRTDGTLNTMGQFTTFANPTKYFKSPGLNCSGLVLEIARRYLKSKISITDSKIDIENDSGKDSHQGEDWDFGLDLIRNISKYGESDILTHSHHSKKSGILFDGNRGFQLHTRANWEYILSRIKPGWLYLLSINKPLHKKGYDLLHYHVGVMQKNELSKKVFYYHTTRLGKTHKIEVSHRRGMQLFQKQFAQSPYAAKYVYLIGVKPHQLEQ